MRVGIVCPYDISKRGGVQQLCVELADRLRSRDNEVVLVAPGEADIEGLRSVGGSISIPSNRSSVPLAANVRSVPLVRKALRDVDVTHVHEPLIPLVGWAALGSGGPVVATFHADPPPWARRFYRLAARPVPRSLRGAVLTSVSDVAASALPSSWGNVRIIPNAIDVGAYRTNDLRRAQRLAFLGRDDPRKGLDHLLAAWGPIRAEFPEAELMVINAKRTQETPGVTYLGSVDESTKRAVLSSSTIFVAPNLGGESFGIILIEAMAAGCAVVASDIPAFRAVVDTAGILVGVGDSAAIAEAVCRLLRDPDTAQELGRLGVDRAQRFDWTRVTERYEQGYSEAIAGTG